MMMISAMMMMMVMIIRYCNRVFVTNIRSILLYAIVGTILNFLIIGFFVAPFLAYPAWRQRAEEKAEKAILLDRVRSGER